MFSPRQAIAATSPAGFARVARSWMYSRSGMGRPLMWSGSGMKFSRESHMLVRFTPGRHEYLRNQWLFCDKDKFTWGASNNGRRVVTFTSGCNERPGSIRTPANRNHPRASRADVALRRSQIDSGPLSQITRPIHTRVRLSDRPSLPSASQMMATANSSHASD